MTKRPPVVDETPEEARAPRYPGQLWYSIPSAAHVLDLSVRGLWAFVYAGEIKVTKCGARVLVHVRDLEKFAARSHAAPVAEK